MATPIRFSKHQFDEKQKLEIATLLERYLAGYANPNYSHIYGADVTSKTITTRWARHEDDGSIKHWTQTQYYADGWTMYFYARTMNRWTDGPLHAIDSCEKSVDLY